MRCVSSSVMLPELPDASMETRKPIALPSIALQNITQTNFQNDGISIPARQREKKNSYQIEELTTSRIETNGVSRVGMASNRKEPRPSGPFCFFAIPQTRFWPSGSFREARWPWIVGT